LLLLRDMEIPFFKYEGAGNDFIMVDNRSGFFKESTESIAGLCNRRFGIGADGLILLENSEGHDFKMVYFNSDGRESTFCGNGGRCIVAFARQLGIVKQEARFMAKDGFHEANFEGELVKLRMMDATLPETQIGGSSIFTGSPHFVQFVEELVSVDVFSEGRRIRNLFGEDGINVNFVEKQNDGLFVRTYERGVEDETLSCGTGVTAAALIAAVEANYKSPIQILSKGGNLRVEFKVLTNGFSDVFLIGPARMVFSGLISLPSA
jgi:diaminopimelate epimerase